MLPAKGKGWGRRKGANCMSCVGHILKKKKAPLGRPHCIRSQTRRQKVPVPRA